LEEDLRRLCSGEPIQYVLGYTVFCGERFRVGPGVLIPRPETEQLVTEAVRLLREAGPGARVLDLCTGSGCLAWSLARAVPGTELVGVDLSESALSYARSQSPSSAGEPAFLRADVLDTEQPFPYGPFDLIVSNPPYVRDSERGAMRPNVLDHEPAEALFVPDGDPLLFYRAVARWAQRFLRPGGAGIVEINEALGAETAAVFRQASFKNVQILPDFAEKDRFIRFSV
jgi:release factor glutamine methyltransferase